jgi:hypothetical protein
MPEYLAPGVYVEEVDTGSKPIEGVSTSTAGMIGVTERGPVNVPMLVTSFGEYQRLFGQMLQPALYPDPQCLHLPNAVEGFFTNGGKRVYVTRILEFLRGAPQTGERRLVAPDAAPPLQARLMHPATPGARNVTIDADPGFAINDIVQVGDGLSADFPQLNAGPAPANLITLRLPLDFAHAGADNVDPINGADNMTAGEVHADTLNVAVAAGVQTIVGTGAGPFNPPLAVGQECGCHDSAQLPNAIWSRFRCSNTSHRHICAGRRAGCHDHRARGESDAWRDGAPCARRSGIRRQPDGHDHERR